MPYFLAFLPRLRRSLLLIPLMALSVWSLGNAASGAEGRAPWDVRASVEARYFVDADSDGQVMHPARAALPSPDGRRFAMLTLRGDLERDVNIYDLAIYDTEAVATQARRGRVTNPLVTVTRTSGMTAAAIANVRWAADGTSLMFEGNESTAFAPTDRQWEYIAEVPSGRVTRVAQLAQNYSMAGHIVDWRNATALFVDFAAPLRTEPYELEYPLQVITPETGRRVEGGRFTLQNTGWAASATGAMENVDPPLALYVLFKGERRLIGSLSDGAKDYGSWPNGRWVAGAIRPLGDVALVAVRFRNSGAAASAQPPPMQYTSIELATGRTTALFAVSTAPTGPNVVLWTADGKSAIVSNVDQSPRAGESAAPYVVQYDMDTKQTIPIAPLTRAGLRFLGLRWNDAQTHLSVEWAGGPYGNAQTIQTAVYGKVNGQWVEQQMPQPSATTITWSRPLFQQYQQQRDITEGTNTAPSGSSMATYLPPQPVAFSNGLSIVLEEDPNNPQRLVARMSWREVTLIDADRSLARVRLAPTRVVEWQTPDGKRHQGTLTLPLQRTRGAHPPLVIQLQPIGLSNAFRPDGAAFSGWAAQTLAARGIAVLNVSGSDVKGETPAEVSETVTNVDAAIDRMVQDHGIDPTRLGAIGFSHTGFLARQVLLQPGRHKFRAASAHDSFTTTYNAYVRSFDLSDMRTVGSGHSLMERYAAFFGAGFWQDRQPWLDRAENFIAHQATGALLEVQSAAGVSGVGRSYGDLIPSFRAVGRPAEFIAMDDSGHRLVRPRQRFALMSVNVDWMDFWLNGYEDKDPVKAETYARWRQLRANWEIQQAWEAAGNRAGTIPTMEFYNRHRAQATQRK